MRKKHGNLKDEEMTSLQRACMIEKWMEKEKKSSNCENNKVVVVRRKSMADSDPVLLNSSSSSSDSSYGGGFSSSESDSFYGATKSRSSSSPPSSHHYRAPKPIRTSVSSSARPDHQNDVVKSQKPKHEGGFVRTKSKALKIYSDLKKVKQPISPGGRLASFLNSLFTAGNAKKAKIVSSSSTAEQGYSSTCSSASSFSRSCLSKTPSSRGNGTKRSVRFCPVSVILDEDSKPCGHKTIYYENDTTTRIKPSNKELEFRIMEENRRVVEAAKDLLKSYQKKKEEFDMNICNNNGNGVFSDEEEEEDDEDEDAASYASSDLFELDNLSAIGTIDHQRYREELPVYETTHLDTNRAIANGFIV
ncbi:hypothetical protein CCACVL1_18758 [Corchorus capsularis]|uniref:Protein BIG GRAIN 1-like A n=1 Tax=Corchorus capsularis TaxID=210143 RepID=A0A1R3HJZ6_COCAP|nr:hypothetical protein CCACVL1_18758 [Corchorus capsularis]